MESKPIFFNRNRVGRVYTGGKLFAGFFEGDAPEDNFLPEEWIASSVEAINKEKRGEREGVSVDAESGRYFDELLREDPKKMLGSTGKMRILVKVLDSAVRLPAQAHPDKAFSRKFFDSEYGKTESWYILNTRPGAKLYFGFKDGVNEEIFSRAIDDSETDKDAMERLMEAIVPEKNDMFLVPAKTVHAIGAGCLILEIQEPTDFTIQPEHWCADYHLNDREMYIGLDKKDAVSCFDFTKAPDTKAIPRSILSSDDCTIENLIGPADTECFVINRITLKSGEYQPCVFDSYGVYIVTKGEGSIVGKNYEHTLRQGDYFFLPCDAMKKFTLKGDMEVIEAY